MSDNGWTRIQRRVFPRNPNAEFYGDGVMQALWTTIITWANWDDGDEPLPFQGVALRRGQLATSLRELEAATGFPKGQIERRLAALVSAGRVVIDDGKNRKQNGKQNGTDNGNKNRKQGTLITVVKYNEYQAPLTDSEKQNGKQNEKQNGNKNGTIRTKEERRKNNKTKNTPPSPVETDEPEHAHEPVGGSVERSKERRAKAMGSRIAHAAARGQIESLSAEDRETLLRHYRTTDRFWSAMERLWKTSGISSPEAFAASRVAQALVHVIDRPELNPPPPEMPHCFGKMEDVPNDP